MTGLFLAFPRRVLAVGVVNLWLLTDKLAEGFVWLLRLNKGSETA